MQIIALTGAEARESRAAKDLLLKAAFLIDAWPDYDQADTTDYMLQNFPDEAQLMAVGDPEGWQWLVGRQKKEFDSLLYGRTMAVLRPLIHRQPWPEPESISLGRQLMGEAINQAREAGADFLETRVGSRDFLSTLVLEASNFHLMAVSVEWMVATDRLPARSTLPAGINIRTWKPQDGEILAGLAAKSFCDLQAYTDRFAVDPRLRSHCGEMYRRWTENSLSGDQADQVLVLEVERQPQGFITLRLPVGGDGPGADCGWVVINVISPQQRGKGLYHHLLLRGLIWLAKHGAGRVRVRTKVSQQAVINSFASLGGQQAYSDLIYHLWLDQLEK